MPEDNDHLWDGIDRRLRTDDRRRVAERRTHQERRLDNRRGDHKGAISLKVIFLNLVKPRLGVDRRKGRERRKLASRRLTEWPTDDLRNLISQEELNALLSNCIDCDELVSTEHGFVIIESQAS